jgi:hypothetical protein
MEKSPTVKKTVGATKGPAGFVSELPETPSLKLPEGKIATATRKTIQRLGVQEGC